MCTTSIFAEVVVINRDYVNTLPLNITNREQFSYYSHADGGEGKAGIYVEKEGTLHFRKTESTTKTGSTTGIIHFNDVPGMLALDVTLGVDNGCAIIWGKHNKLVVFTSKDGENYNQLDEIYFKGGSFKYKLNKDDRYIKFTYSSSSGLCGHKYSPVKINLPKVLTDYAETFEMNGYLSSVISDTLAIDYSNPQGDLILTSEDGNMTIERLTELEAGKEGKALFKVNYITDVVGEYLGDIIVKDALNEQVTMTIPYKIVSELDFFPEAPSVKLENKSFETFTVSWNEIERVEDYKITVEHAGNVFVDEAVKTTSYKLNNLVRGEEYKVSVTAIADNGNQSKVPGEISVKLNNDFGAQFSNDGFEVWDLITEKYGYEPQNWNSFGTAYAANVILNAAKGKQVEESNNIRPGSKGKLSANIYSKYVNIAKTIANGNLTTGRIHAGSTTPTSLDNYNALIMDDAAFNQSLGNVLPDSMSVWVKYVPGIAKEDLYARVSFIAHAEGVVKDPRDPNDEATKLIIATAEHNYNEANQWIRLSVPFVLNSGYDQSSNAEKIYILGSFTTNMTPGVATDASGEVADNVYIDDLLFIYNPTVAINALSNNILEEGESFNIDFNLNGTMSASNINEERNQVTVELSDINGSFENPITISATPKLTDESGIITAVLPDQLHSGIYKVRVSTSNYPMKSEPVEIEVKGSLVTSIDEDTMNNINISLYPNPAKNIINVLGASGMDYRIYNVNGSLIVKGCMIESSINISNLTEGIYFIEFISESGKSVIKFIKE